MSNTHMNKDYTRMLNEIKIIKEKTERETPNSNRETTAEDSPGNMPWRELEDMKRSSSCFMSLTRDKWYKVNTEWDPPPPCGAYNP